MDGGRGCSFIRVYFFAGRGFLLWVGVCVCGWGVEGGVGVFSGKIAVPLTHWTDSFSYSLDAVRIMSRLCYLAGDGKPKNPDLYYSTGKFNLLSTVC